MKDRKEQIEIIEELLDRCNDSRLGYEQAADTSDNKALKLHFHNIALERGDFGRDLSAVLIGLGGEPSESGTFKGAANRNWLNIKAILSSSTEEAIIEECMAGDKRLIEDYVKAVSKASLSKEMENILAHQLGNVEARVNRLEKIEESTS